MIQFTKEIYQPRLNTEAGYQVSIVSYSDFIEDKEGFMGWLAKQVAENGAGEHSSIFSYDGKEIEVKYEVVTTSITHSAGFLQMKSA